MITPGSSFFCWCNWAVMSRLPVQDLWRRVSCEQQFILSLCAFSCTLRRLSSCQCLYPWQCTFVDPSGRLILVSPFRDSKHSLVSSVRSSTFHSETLHWRLSFLVLLGLQCPSSKGLRNMSREFFHWPSLASQYICFGRHFIGHACVREFSCLSEQRLLPCRQWPANTSADMAMIWWQGASLACRVLM